MRLVPVPFLCLFLRMQCMAHHKGPCRLMDEGVALLQRYDQSPRTGHHRRDLAIPIRHINIIPIRPSQAA